MKGKKYIHKFRQVVTDKFVIRLNDFRSEMPKSALTVSISGLFSQDASISVDEARELEKALHIVLRRIGEQDGQQRTGQQAKANR